jgi:anti-sigma factor (TIGR02949 family)
MKSGNMNCTEARIELSAYLDQALSWEQRARLDRHTETCRECQVHAEQLGAVTQLVRQARVMPPADLELRVRLHVARAAQPAMGLASAVFGRLSVHLSNFLRPVAIPAVSGLLTAMLIFGGFIYQFALPLDITNDVPLALQTSPRLRVLPPVHFTNSPDGVLVQTEVDDHGRITNFQVLDGAGDELQLRELRNWLVLTQFDPATRFGVPISGRTVIKFRGISISVKG